MAVKRTNIIGIALVGVLMGAISLKSLITESMELSRRRWGSGTDITITGTDAKVFGLVGLAMSLLILGACLGLWFKHPRE